MKVIGYTYDADHHCIDCTTAYLKGGTQSRTPPHPMQIVRWLNGEDEFPDSEGNPIHPIFDTDEWYANEMSDGEPEAVLGCGTCGKEIDRIRLDDE